MRQMAKGISGYTLDFLFSIESANGIGFLLHYVHCATWCYRLTQNSIHVHKASHILDGRGMGGMKQEFRLVEMHSCITCGKMPCVLPVIQC